MSMQTYKSIHDLPLFNFDRYLATKDLNWFLIKYDGRQKRIENEHLKATESFIMDEYYKELQDRQFEIKLQKWAKIDELTLKYNVLNSVIVGFAYGFQNTPKGQELRMKFIELLKGYKIKIPVMNTPQGDVEELIKVKAQLENIKTQIKMIQDELKVDGKKQQHNLYKQLRMVSLALGQKDVANPKEITVAQWIADCKLAKEISGQN
jgi:RNase H-fold protein (predicted Holliday junction resolvase)